MTELGECENKACAEDAAEIIRGDAMCAVHARMWREDHPPLNGKKLIMALPMISATRGIRGWYVVVELLPSTSTHEYVEPFPSAHEYVVAWVDALDSPWWDGGDYIHGLNEAIRACYLRAGVHVMPWADIAAKTVQ